MRVVTIRAPGGTEGEPVVVRHIPAGVWVLSWHVDAGPGAG